MRRLAVVAALLMVLPITVKAAHGQISGVEVTVSYDEPRVNTDRSPIKDLKKTTVYWHWKGKPDRVFKAVEVPASKPTGGGKVTVRLLIPLAERQGREVTIYTTASDQTGHESGRSNEATVQIDRLPPPR